MCQSDYADRDKEDAKNNPTPESMKNGLNYGDRSCTDIPMCLVFCVFIIGMFCTAAYGYANGDPYKLVTPFDSDGRICGSEGTPTEGYPYLHFPDIFSLNYNLTVCVKECPQEDQPVYCAAVTTWSDYTCDYSVLGIPPRNNYSLYNTTLYIDRFCIPTDAATEYATDMLNSTQDSKLGSYMGDLAVCWWVILVMCGISGVLALIYLFLLRLIVKPVLYISFVLILALLIGGGAYVYVMHEEWAEGDRTREIMKWMAYILWILAAIYLLIMLCCCSRIQLGVAIMKATSKFVANTISVFFIPLIFFVIVLAFIAIWLVSAIFVYSVGEVERSQYGPYAEMIWNDVTRYVWLYHLFGLFWISAFIIGSAQMIVAGAACIWYFSQGGQADDKGGWPLSKATKWLIRYHVGSVAFGALIIAIMQMIKLCFEYFRRKFQNKIGENCLTKCIFGCIGCCILCLDRVVRIITKNAYIQVILTETFFCKACAQAFFLIVRNCARFAIISGIGSILMFLGKAVVMGLSCFIAYLIIMNSDLQEQVNSPIFPCIVVLIVAYLIGSIFLSVYSFSSTAILHCFILNEDLGIPDHPECLDDFIKTNDKYNEKNKRKGKQTEDNKDDKKDDQKGPSDDKAPNNMS